MNTIRQPRCNKSLAIAALHNKNLKHFLYEDKGVIGRTPSAFVSITDDRISRQHCVIQRTEDNKFTICDSSNSGTFINDKPLTRLQPQELNHLDRINLAGLEQYTFVFLINNRRLGIKSSGRHKRCSPLREKMIDLNETQSLEKESMENDLTLIETEMNKLKEELQVKINAREENLQKSKIEVEKRHQVERELLENKCKAEIEELKEKLKTSELKNQQFEELEQQRLFEAKVEVETKLESKIVDLTCEEKNKEEQVNELKRKLREKEEQEEKVKNEIEGLEDDMMCSICAELYIEPTALNCGHMFCKLCINEWNKKKKICPMCRANIKTTVRIFIMDSVIEKNIRLMPEEARTRRETVIAERKRRKTPRKDQRSSKKRRHDLPPNLPAPHEPVVSVQINMENEPLEFPHLNIRQAVRMRDPDPFRMNSELMDDPFLRGWVTPPMRMVGPIGWNTPVSVAAVDLTNHRGTDEPMRTRARTHTATSTNPNTTIDLTDM